MNARDAHLSQIAAEHGTPFYAYFLDEVRERARALRVGFGNRFAISYAVKANPAHGLLVGLLGHVEGLDVSSGGELLTAGEAGWPSASISFTGPGKTERELQAAAARFAERDGEPGGEVVLESIEEAAQLAAIARAAGARVRVLLRIAPARVPPGFGDSMAGKPVAFGVDEESLEPALAAIAAHADTLALVGFHAYSGTQCLRAQSIVENYEIFADVFRRAARLSGRAPAKLVFGSGLGIPYHEGQSALDLEQVGQGTQPVLDRLRAEFPGVALWLETGRFLVGEAGVLVTRVLRTKDSRGTRIGICDAGMNHHLAAAGMFGMAIRRNYRIRNLSSDAPPSGCYQLSGPLCTSLDVLARGAPLSRVEAGDLIAIETSGAYGPSASPGRFISHPPVAEWIVDGDVTRPAGATR